MKYTLYIVIALQVLDIFTTYFCLTKGKGFEANKLLAKLFDKVGLLPGLFLVKGTFITLLLITAPLVPIELIYIIAVGYLWVVYNNIKIIIKS